MNTERSERETPDGKGRLTITIYNEDNGDSLPLHAGRGAPVRTIIGRMYEKWGIERSDGDRLRCEDDGGTVWGHEDEKLGDFADRCGLTWLFAGEHGGANR